MSKLAAVLGGQPGVIVGAALAVAGAAAGGYLFLREPPQAAEAPVTEVVQPAPETPVASEETAQAPEAESPVAPEPEDVAVAPAPQDEATETVADLPATPPRFDEVRTEADGLTVIAGRAEPGSTVTVLVDGEKAEATTAGSDGTFVTIAILDASTKARVVTLLQDADGRQTPSETEIILAPTPVVVAAVAPEPEAPVADAPVVAEPVVAEPAAPQPASETEVAEAEPEVVETPEPVAEAIAEDDTAPETPAPTETVEQAEAPELRETETADVETEVKTAEAVAEPATPETPAAQPEPEPEPQVAILQADATGVEVINRSSAPSVMSNVAIDTISYSEVGNVLLSGRAQEEAEVVRVYLDNAPVTTLEVDDSGRWRGDLPDVDTGVYTLRVDELDAEGEVTSRVETPFKREDPEVLTEATEDTDAPVAAITVQTGATLWAIARERYGDGTLYVRVVEANRDTIKNPDLIYPGQIFDLPE